MKTLNRALFVGLVSGGGVVALATAIAWTVLGHKELADVVMVYLLGVVIVSMRFGYAPSLLAAVLSVMTFDFFFVPPYFTFRVSDLRHIATFGVMFFVAVVISGLTKRVREQADEAHRARLRIEAEQLRNAVLSSVSHDFKTPLAVVTGAASTLLDERLEPSVRRELTDTILQEAERLNRLLQNLLDMSRLDSGAVSAKKEWEPLEEVIGAALNRMESTLGGRDVVVRVPDELPLVPLDSVLIEQVLVNLLENVAKYTPGTARVTVVARMRGRDVEIEVADDGPGVPSGSEERVFDKFYRAETDRGGAGLGLTICRGLVAAHGGRIWLLPRNGPGASFHFTLPLESQTPKLTEAASGLSALSTEEVKS